MRGEHRAPEQGPRERVGSGRRAPETRAPAEVAHSTGWAVEAQGLSKTYKSVTVVDGITLRVRRGETLGILGSNGAGKTTAVEMIAGLRRPDQGRVRLMGLDPVQDRAQVRQMLGVQLQGADLHDALTCKELVDLYRSFYPDPLGTDEVLDMVGLNAKAGTRFSRLSGGQQQRLSIALALLGRPRIVILDELTTGLDPGARRRVWRTIRSLTAQTVILVSHAMDEVERLCDRAAVLHEGRIVAQGTPAELKELTDSATLEDAFVALTGQELGDGEDAEDEGGAHHAR